MRNIPPPLPDPAAQARGKRNKRRGKDGQKEWCEVVVARIGGECEHRGTDRDARFWHNALENLHGEIKRRVKIGVARFCEQAFRDMIRHAEDGWYVAWREDACGGRRQWRVTQDAEPWLDDKQELHELRAEVERLREGSDVG